MNIHDEARIAQIRQQYLVGCESPDPNLDDELFCLALGIAEDRETWLAFTEQHWENTSPTLFSRLFKLLHCYREELEELKAVS